METETPEAVRVYRRGLAGFAELGELGRIPLENAYHMFDTLARHDPGEAGAWEARFNGARQALLEGAALREARDAGLAAEAEELRATSRRTGVPVSELRRIRAGGVERDLVEARAALYRM